MIKIPSLIRQLGGTSSARKITFLGVGVRANASAGLGGRWPKGNHEQSRAFNRNVIHTSAISSYVTARHSVHGFTGIRVRSTVQHSSPYPHASFTLRATVAPWPWAQVMTREYSEQKLNVQRQNDNDIPYPDVLKEDEHPAFKEWFNNCMEFHLPGCMEQIKHLTAGEKSMSQLCAEQRKLLESIASTYQEYGLYVPPGDTTFCPFSAQGVQEGFGGVRVQNAKDFETDGPCPEGVQDLDCQRLQQYLDLCKYYRFMDCNVQLTKLHNGENSITELLKEREKLLQGIVRYCSANTTEASGDSASSTQQATAELSQMQRFKQMVKEYGTVVVIFHVCISLISLGICYTAVSR